MPGTFPESSAAGEEAAPAPTTSVAPESALTAPVRLGAGIGVWVRDLIISLAISAFIIIFLYQPVKVEGTSMMPSLQDQERIFVNKFVYRLEPIERGDIVVFRYPRDPSKSYIKRVIGMPGDRVEVDQGKVIVNGQTLVESYVPPEFRDQSSMPVHMIPEGEYFVLGDHRNSSSDSRSWGFVGRDGIYGKAVLVYWPFEKIGPVR